MEPLKAPTEPIKAEAGLSREELEQALEGSTVEQLREMARRLTKSHEGLTEMLADLEAEGQSLREESEYLTSTIDLMMKELHKLNIGAGNTVEPQLDEGPLAFVGRYWEKVKPRDTAYQTSEHVGEIRKPVPFDGTPQPPTAQEIAQHASQQVVQTAQRIQGALGPLWQRTQGFLSEKQSEIAGAVARAKQRARREGAKRPPGSRPDAAEPGAQPDGTSDGKAAQEGNAAASSSDAPTEEAALEATTSSRLPGAEEQSASTILIEARLKVDDGSILTLRVSAADRCKEVAQRFVNENSLKAWFQDPLTAWLKKVEADAEKFPAIVEADLSEIRKQYSKSK